MSIGGSAMRYDMFASVAAEDNPRSTRVSSSCLSTSRRCSTKHHFRQLRHSTEQSTGAYKVGLLSLICRVVQVRQQKQQKDRAARRVQALGRRVYVDDEEGEGQWMKGRTVEK